jgi:hypothetical protein
MSPKNLLKQYYNSDIFNNLNLVDTFYHKDCEVHWNSSKGFQILKYDDVYAFFKSINESYVALRYEISHLIEEDNFVTSRYTVFARTIENEDEETPLAHYICIWEIKDNKLYKGYQISQLASDKAIQSNSFAEIKV